MRRKRPPETGPVAWRDAPRDENEAMKPFPQKERFIAHLRATNRPTSKDLRILRALKKAKPPVEG